MLREQLLDLREADGSPVLDPGLGEVVGDVVQSPVAHALMIVTGMRRVHGPDGSFFGAQGLIP